MAKFGKVTEETQELVDKISNETGLIQFIDIEAVSVPKSKKVIDIKRCPPLGEHVAGKSEVVCVIVYEKAFEHDLYSDTWKLYTCAQSEYSCRNGRRRKSFCSSS